MEIGDWVATRDLNDLFRELRRLDLLGHVAELDAFGFTIVPPERVGHAGVVERMRERILQIAEERSGSRPDTDEGAARLNPARPGLHLFYLLLEDPLFQDAVLNPVTLNLIAYLLGQSCRLSSVTSIVKGPGTAFTHLHADLETAPAPFPAYSQLANATLLLSDYTRENGALCFVPGSHRFCRHPTSSERNPLTSPKAVPVEAPAGSLVVWHGNTWHGAYPRKNPGLRMNLIMLFTRVYIREQEPYLQHLEPDALAALPERLRLLLGEREALGWTEEGPDMKQFATRAGQTLHA